MEWNDLLGTLGLIPLVKKDIVKGNVSKKNQNEIKKTITKGMRMGMMMQYMAME